MNTPLLRPVHAITMRLGMSPYQSNLIREALASQFNAEIEAFGNRFLDYGGRDFVFTVAEGIDVITQQRLVKGLLEDAGWRAVPMSVGDPLHTKTLRFTVSCPT